ncbi:cysteine methyltransferase [Platysternon megacephalum]|uniref:Cysteine methyltransferase n=1 Tax=Platysternon megacephalum TaxID=55544 RepID=A0A4D9DG99_9SAUR|nr:cysteine methyltransferase [Platysternon megacephalum]
MGSELGRLLDPLADKALLISIYVALGVAGFIPKWLVILVVSRDVMIIGAFIVSWLVNRPIPIRPAMVSKLNTAAQVAFAALVLAAYGFNLAVGPLDSVLMGLVAVLTLASIAVYLIEWIRHMGGIERAPR